MSETSHRIFFRSSVDMDFLADESVELVVTSPPYPMIEMWDETFAAQDESGAVDRALSEGGGAKAFELMHRILDEVWRECSRVLKPGGFACINIGDATRSIGGSFRLYSNHARIISACTELGFQTLPAVLWRKQTNGPTKFMGSGMLPAGAYVTLEHEYILILRKGGKRSFDEEEKGRRRRSAIFWEERNTWFSDLWDLKGVRQEMEAGNGPGSAASGHVPASQGGAASQRNSASDLGPLFDGNSAGRPQPGTDAGADVKQARKRSAAFPFEIAYRLINMYSLAGDTVLDPFLGTGTTTAAAIAADRSSIGIELDDEISDNIRSLVLRLAPEMNRRIRRRFEEHLAFVKTYAERKGADPGVEPGHLNEYYGFRVVTGQERELRIPYVESIEVAESAEAQPPARAADLRFTAAYRENRDISADADPDISELTRTGP